MIVISAIIHKQDGADMTNHNGKPSNYRSKNRIMIRGIITSEIKVLQNCYVFNVTTYDEHKGKSYETVHLVRAGLSLKSTIEKSKLGDMVEIEGPLSQEKHIIVSDLMNYSLTLRETPSC